VTQKKVDHHAVCEYNLHKLLLNNGFILVQCRCQDPEMIKKYNNIICNIVHVKYYLWRHSWFHMFESAGFHWVGNRTVSETTGFSHCSKEWTYSTTFWL